MSEQKNGPGGIIQELRNRRVFRAVAVYLGVGFALLEAADIVIPMLGLPVYVVKTVFWLLIAGFPVAIGLAWTFQLTPEGLRRSPKSGEKQTEAQKPFTGNAMIIVLLLVIVGLLAYPRMQSSPPPDVATTNQQADSLDAKAVAVLPFTNFSASEEDAYFADGIHDDILTQLSKIRDLKIISRTTMIKYKASDLSISEIAREVGAANILEGSVRRAGDQVRIVAQLIKAKSDEHLWAETYDREYADIFAIQTDVARKIASALKSALTPREELELDDIPTANMEAYDYFLKGNYFWHTKTTKEGNMQAVAMYEKAIELDPTFGLAYARQSIVHSVLYQQRDWDSTPERKAMALKTLKQAKSLIPDHPEVHFAQGVYYKWCLKDNEAAIAEFEIAFEGQPSNGEIANHLGELYALAGNWSKAEYYINKAYELAPDGINHATWVAGYSFMMGDYEQAIEYHRLALQNNAEASFQYRQYAETVRYAYGDLERSRQIVNDGILNSDNPKLFPSDLITINLETRNFAAALKVVQEDYDGDFRALHRSICYYFLGEEALLRRDLDSARTNLLGMIKKEPENGFLYSRLGVVEALGGEKKRAIEYGKKGLEITPVELDALEGPTHVFILAIIYSLVGEDDLALDLLEDLLTYPSGITPWRIKLHPAFDGLKDNLRYQKLTIPSA